MNREQLIEALNRFAVRQQISLRDYVAVEMALHGDISGLKMLRKQIIAGINGCVADHYSNDHSGYAHSEIKAYAKRFVPEIETMSGLPIELLFIVAIVTLSDSGRVSTEDEAFGFGYELVNRASGDENLPDDALMDQQWLLDIIPEMEINRPDED